MDETLAMATIVSFMGWRSRTCLSSSNPCTISCVSSIVMVGSNSMPFCPILPSDLIIVPPCYSCTTLFKILSLIVVPLLPSVLVKSYGLSSVDSVILNSH